MKWMTSTQHHVQYDSYRPHIAVNIIGKIALQYFWSHKLKRSTLSAQRVLENDSLCIFKVSDNNPQETVGLNSKGIRASTKTQ
eukprot:Nitzschia sp. Nitz4//NODE_611_length_9286_cov_71.495179//7534//7782//NITZ4_additional_000091-RA//-1//CDS//3329532005//3941//frame0